MEIGSKVVIATILVDLNLVVWYRITVHSIAAGRVEG